MLQRLRNISHAFKDGKTSIPLEIIQIIQDNNLQKPFATFLGLKMISSGKLHRQDPKIKDLIKDLNTTTRTFNRHVKLMKSINFIGESSSGYLYIRGWNNLRRMYKIGGIAAVVFYPKYIKNIKEFLFSALTAININTQNWQIRQEKRIGGAQSGTSFIQDHSSYAGLSIEGFIRIAGVSRATAQKLKNSSIERGLLHAIKHQREVAVVEHSPMSISNFIKYHPEYENHKMIVERISSDRIRLLVSNKDEIRHNLIFVRKKKLESKKFIKKVML